jgi:hypothetical protein
VNEQKPVAQEEMILKLSLDHWVACWRIEKEMVIGYPVDSRFLLPGYTIGIVI